MIKKMKWILPIAAVLLIIAIWLIHFFHTKTRFNDTYVNGNTAGNLYTAACSASMTVPSILQIPMTITAFTPCL